MAKRVVSVFTGVAILLIAAQVPAAAKGTMTYVASGGDLDHRVSFDSTLFDAVWSRDQGPYWREESSVPALPSGIRYRIDIYFDEVQQRQLVEQWIYVPAASGAIEVKPNAYARTSDGAIIRWRAFSPDFNAIFLRAVRNGSPFPLGGFAVAVGMLLLVSGAALGLRETRGWRVPIPEQL